jgi:hypothetical protein
MFHLDSYNPEDRLMMQRLESGGMVKRYPASARPEVWPQAIWLHNFSLNCQAGLPRILMGKVGVMFESRYMAAIEERNLEA